ncbi:MAG TPA: hypothetical protein VMU02_01855, partial [bacterium]|nr:hypothetical protein [bacterium]
MLRTSLREMVMVGSVASIVALVGTGTVSPKLFDGFADLGRLVADAVLSIRSSVSSMVSTPPPKPVPGPACVLVAAEGTVLALDGAGMVASEDTACCRTDLPVMTGFVPPVAAVG